jgi:mono/diheme cytochrome c family protein
VRHAGEVLGVTAALAALAILPVAFRAQAVKQPVYVGARACARCHEGKGVGNQYSYWLTTAHSKVWVLLAIFEAKVMACFSGIFDEPEKVFVCLGCHATVVDAESWERDVGFRLEDGVQCEKCHGPGSEYMDEQVMRDFEAARRAGLRKFTKRDCAVCHYVKGSHVAVHRKPALDVDKAWEVLAHPVPRELARPNPPALRSRPAPGPKHGPTSAGPATRARDGLPVEPGSMSPTRRRTRPLDARARRLRSGRDH